MAEQPTCELKNTRQRIEAQKANLSGSTFTDVNLAGAAFNDVKLTGATIVNACLGEVRIEDVNLSGAQITQANLSGAAITDSSMTGMTIDGILVTDLISAYRRANQKGSTSGLARPALELPMAKEIICTPNAPSPPPTYSQAIRAAGLVFVSGTSPHDPVTGKIVGDTIQEQTRQCLTNISAILKAAGSSLERVVSATVIILEEIDFAGMNQEWVKWFPENPPARQGAKMPVRIPGMKVSIAVIAEA